MFDAATAGVALGVGSMAANMLTGYLNYQNQQDVLSWQKGVQRNIFGREDTSIQRRVADLKAAGLSPVLAAGQGAGTGGTVSVNAPQLELGDNALVAMNLLKMEQDISATRAQEEYTKMQQKNAEELLPAQLSQMEAQIKNLDATAYKTYQDAKKAKVEAKNAEDTGFVPRTTFGGWLFDAVNAGTAAAEKTKQLKKSKGKPVKPDLTPVKPGIINDSQEHLNNKNNGQKPKYF